MERKVLIVTMPPSDNYGNRLQNFAVQQVLEGLGYAPSTLVVPQAEYDRSLTPEQPFWHKLTPAHVKQYVLDRKPCDKEDAQREQRLARFADFDQRYIRFTPFAFLHDNVPFAALKDFDFAVCGSDQIWNPRYGMPSLYFLDFMPQHKRVALAPSLGVDTLDACYQAEYRKMLCGMQHLSAREQSGADILQALTGQSVPALQDPTFWIGAEQWREMAKAPAHIPQKPYLLCYFLGRITTAYQKKIDLYAKAHGLAVTHIANRDFPEYYAAGPCEFLWLAAHADMICTDSFHGVAFSLIFNRPFAAFERTDGQGMETRIPSILQHVGLDRMQQNVRVAQALEICFDHVNAVLAKDRQAAKDYILRAAAEIAQQKIGVDLAPKSYCTGCRACEVSCPVGAIDWVADDEGFCYPRVKADACIGCGACSRACPVLGNEVEEDERLPDALAAWALDRDVRAASSSGGLFSVLASKIIARGGVVFGAGFDGHWHVRHTYMERAEQLPLLRTSKYVQSEIGDCYVRAKEFLDAGRWVYFSGTPCQIRGLRAYLAREYDRLILQDIVCHGVPSQKVWDAYLAKHHAGAGAVRSINFGDKSMGWQQFAMRIDKEGSPAFCKAHDRDAYMQAFLGNLSLRPSCYQCVNRKASRTCDITLADFWGVERMYPELEAKDGVSLVLVQSPKGKQLLDAVSDHIFSMPVDSARALSYNACATRSVQKQRGRRNAFFDAYQKDFDAAVKRASRVSAYTRVRRMLGSIKYKILKG